MRHLRPLLLAIGVLVGGGLVLGAASPAEAVGISKRGKRPDRNYFNFRVGSAVTAAGRAQMCMEVSPHSRIGIEACGTGATWFHQDDVADVMHLRALFRIDSYATPIGYVQPRVGLGVAEMAVGADDSGLYFGSTGPRGVETAGPEATASLRLLTPIYEGFELITNIDATVGYFKHAPDLVKPRDAIAPGLMATLGFGF